MSSFLSNLKAFNTALNQLVTDLNTGNAMDCLDSMSSGPYNAAFQAVQADPCLDLNGADPYNWGQYESLYFCVADSPPEGLGNGVPTPTLQQCKAQAARLAPIQKYITKLIQTIGKSKKRAA